MFYGKKEIKVKKSNRKVLYKYRKSGDLLVKHGLLYDKNAQVSAFFRRKKIVSLENQLLLGMRCVIKALTSTFGT